MTKLVESQRVMRSGHLTRALHKVEPSDEPVTPTKNSPLGTSVEVEQDALETSLFKLAGHALSYTVTETMDVPIISIFRIQKRS
jgi:hypothetical protein